MPKLTCDIHDKKRMDREVLGEEGDADGTYLIQSVLWFCRECYPDGFHKGRVEHSKGGKE